MAAIVLVSYVPPALMWTSNPANAITSVPREMIIGTCDQIFLLKEAKAVMRNLKERVFN